MQTARAATPSRRRLNLVAALWNYQLCDTEYSDWVEIEENEHVRTGGALRPECREMGPERRRRARGGGAGAAGNAVAAATGAAVDLEGPRYRRFLKPACDRAIPGA